MLLLFYDSLIYPRFTRNVGFHFTEIIKNILCPCLCGNKFQALDETERTVKLSLQLRVKHFGL